MGIKPCPPFKGLSALPITAPNASNGLLAFMAWPGMPEVVNRSPTSTDEECASTLQNTLPSRPIGSLLVLRVMRVEHNTWLVAAGARDHTRHPLVVGPVTFAQGTVVAQDHHGSRFDIIRDVEFSAQSA